MTKTEIIWAVTQLILILIAGFLLGWAGNEWWDQWEYEREYNGLYLQNYRNYSDVRNTLDEYDEYGDWVCINTRGMDFEDCERTAIHECSHEVYAEYMENQGNRTKLWEMIEWIENGS